ncbi:hypothetical protein AVEN_199731-1 [Araneus ventricosus]|uniref:Uncharacterized protein n=1 Tax=Araneus ventricosus TaxID=182803 RepID=A0A4Y2LJE3_ARAVE|nr:hypothetical protein AVEN_199731-1 [Araneus ventricosus]
MTRTTPELAPPLQTSAPAGVQLAPTDLTSSAESGFEPGAFRPRGRDLTTSPTKFIGCFFFHYSFDKRIKFVSKWSLFVFQWRRGNNFFTLYSPSWDPLALRERPPPHIKNREIITEAENVRIICLPLLRRRCTSEALRRLNEGLHHYNE